MSRKLLGTGYMYTVVIGYKVYNVLVIVKLIIIIICGNKMPTRCNR